MADGRLSQVDVTALTKGRRRKPTALRKSVGDEIGERAFANWFSSRNSAANPETDEDLALIADTLWPLVKEETLAIPRGGYLLRRGGGRIIAERGRS